MEDDVKGTWLILQGGDNITLQLMVEFNDPDVDLRHVLVSAIESLLDRLVQHPPWRV